MSPVSKKTMRRILAAPPAVARFMKDVLEAAEDDLIPLLRNFDSWGFPKGDLFQWIDVLNRCDAILETICVRYSLKTDLQKTSFSIHDRDLVISILKFSIFLLDHCANRSLYASGNLIDDLLGTTDVDVLEQVARIALRLAQRASHQRGGRTHFPLSQDKLWKLATSLQHLNRDYSQSTIPMSDLVGSPGSIQKDWSNLRYTYFLTEANMRTKHDFEVITSPTPTRKRTDLPEQDLPIRDDSFLTRTAVNPEGFGTIDIGYSAIQSGSFESLLWNIITSYNLPPEDHFDLMLRLRFCKYVEDRSTMVKLINIRILALATSAFIVPEPVLQAKFFAIEGNIISQLARFAHPDFQVSQGITAACLGALEAIAHHRPRLGDVLSVLGASINHGTLMYALRTSLTTLQEVPSSSSTELVDALMSLLHYLSTTNVAGSMLCSAGLIQLLVNFITELGHGTLRTVVKALNLLDHLVYGFPQAFSIFCDTRGVTILVDRIAQEVNETILQGSRSLDIKDTNKTDYAMSHEKFSLLKTMLKFIVHMMQTTGTADGLRNLIESPLLTSMRLIYSNIPIFGSSIFASTTNILATFIHNEPSNYQILHEAQLPELFLRSVKMAILPAADVMTAIPNAFGAICLNTQGLALFKNLEPLKTFMAIFSSPKHCEILRESDIAGLLGSSIDELVRHHPSLKSEVDLGIIATLQAIANTGHRASMIHNDCTFTACITEKSSSEGKHAMFLDEDESYRPMVVLYIDIFARYLEGYLQNPTHSQTFVSHDGISHLLRLYGLETLPYDFAKSHAALSLSHVLRLASEANSQMLIDAIFTKVSSTLHDLQPITQFTGSGSFFDPYLNGERTELEATALVHNLQITHSLVVLLSDLYASPIVSNVRSITSFCHTFTTNARHGEMLSELARLHRNIIWEDVKLADQLPPEWLEATQPMDDNKLDEKKEESSRVSLSEVQIASDKYHDLKMVRFFLCQIPPCIVPFYQGLSKLLFSNRRVADQPEKLAALQVARIISKSLEEHLQWQPHASSGEACKQSYHLMILTVVQMLICDERRSSELMTSLLIGFEVGLDIMSQLLLHYWKRLCSAHSSSSTSSAQESFVDKKVARLSGITQLILYLFQRLTSAKHFLESPQTLSLDCKDRNKDKPGYFNPRTYLTQMRKRILPYGLALWQTSGHEASVVSIARYLIIVLTQCISDGPGSSIACDDNGNDLVGSAYNIEVVHSQINMAEPLAEAEKYQSAIHENLNILRLPSEVLQELLQGSISHTMVLLNLYKDEVAFELVDFVLATMAWPTVSSAWVQHHIDAVLEAIRDMVLNLPTNAETSSFMAICHFMAVLAYNPTFYDKCSSKLNESLSDVVDLTILSSHKIHDLNDEAITGVTHLLMCSDAILCHVEKPFFESGQEMSSVSDLKPSSAKLDPGIYARLCESCLKILPCARNRIAILCILRLLIRLLRKPGIVEICLKFSSIAHAFAAANSIIHECDEMTKITLVLFVRRLVESRKQLSGAFEIELCQWFDSKTRSVDVANFVKQNLFIALKDPTLFIETTVALCHFPKYESQSALQMIARKATDAPISAIQDALMDEDISHGDKSPDSEDAVQPNQPVITFLLSEIQKTFADFKRDVSRKQEHKISEDQPQHISHNEDAFVSQDHPAYLYLCLLLQCLTELLASYTECKTSFMCYQSQKQFMVSLELSHQSQGSIIYYFLHELNIEVMLVEGSNQQKMWHVVDGWIKSALVALCADVKEPNCQTTTESVRILTLEILQKSIKDVITIMLPIALRHNQFMMLSELLQRLISSSVLPTPYLGSQQANDTHKTIAKLMLERNFVGLLASVVSEIDLRSPDSRKVVKSVMRPIRTLTKLANRMSDLPGLKFITGTHDDDAAEDFGNSDVAVDVNETTNREDTPDLYRNSALGLFGAELHDSDQEEYDSDEDEEM